MTTETGKQPSGLADSGNKKQKRDEEGEENGEDGDKGEVRMESRSGQKASKCRCT